MPYSVSELATRWDVSRQTIYRMIQSGQLRVFTVGAGSTRKQVRVRDESVTKIEDPDQEPGKTPNRRRPVRRWA